MLRGRLRPGLLTCVTGEATAMPVTPGDGTVHGGARHHVPRLKASNDLPRAGDVVASPISDIM